MSLYVIIGFVVVIVLFWVTMNDMDKINQKINQLVNRIEELEEK